MTTALHRGEMKPILGEPCAWPAAEKVDKAVRTARRAVIGARAATEDFVTQASLEVRRRPLTAVGLSATAGFVTGCAFGCAAGWFWRRQP